MPRPMVPRWRRAHPLAMAVVMGLVLTAPHAHAADASLHERIDQLIEGTSPVPVAPPAGDGEFLRRAYLDLNGTLPDASTVRAFLNDPAANKRELLIDRLLSRPQFARHMQRVFDVMWMERRPEKAVSVAEWQEYLRKSFEDNKPLDQLAREILAADGVDPSSRPAARFYLDRDGDPNLLARDIGRLFFGRDMQCAQCHDHPIVEDYLQADYYGLMAFVNRGTLFTDKDNKVMYAEKADGEVNYKSVFTGDARDHVLPKMPQGSPVSEPALAKEEQYVVAPTDGVRPVPKYSRRAQLAAQATSGASAAFNRNLANRLWAQMMGRGIVHPLDVQHSGNPAVQSQLLAVLAEELVRMKFDARSFLRELALTRAYQRTSEAVAAAGMKFDPAASSAMRAAWNTETERLAGEVPPLQTASAQAMTEMNAAYEQFSKRATANDAAQKVRAEAKKASDDVSAALAAAIKDVGAKNETQQALAAARDKAQAAVAKLPDDKPLAEAAALFKTRFEQVEGQLAAARKVVTERTAQVQAASLRLAEADKTIAGMAVELTASRAAVDAADAKARETIEKLRAAKALQRELTARIADADMALEFQVLQDKARASQAAAQVAADQLAALKSQMSTTPEQLAQPSEAARLATEQAATDRAGVDRAWDAVVDRSTVRFTLAPLKPLSPEQLAWATMQAVGQVDVQIAALEPQAKKDAEAIADLNPEQRSQAATRLLEKAIDEKLRGNVGQFVSLFGQQPGHAATFQATVHQALFFANGGLLAGWLNPGGNNLTERLAKIQESAAVADELYVTVLSRRPLAEEQSQIAAYWEASKTDRAAAAREMIWSLLTSSEFRFNH